MFSIACPYHGLCALHNRVGHIHFSSRLQHGNLRFAIGDLNLHKLTAACGFLGKKKKRKGKKAIICQLETLSV